MNIFLLLIVGLSAGVLSGLIGVGGGIMLIPALTLGFGLSQHMAQGTTLALMVPPIGLLAAWTYYKDGNVDLRVAGLICLGFFFGGLFGAKLAAVINATVLKKLFGAALLVTALKMILSK